VEREGHLADLGEAVTAILLAISLRLNAPSLDVFGPGPLLNLGEEQANTNAIAHVWFGLACPLALTRWARGSPWLAGTICGGAVLARETFAHGPTPGPEVRTDLLSGLLPILAVVLVESLR
jgi:hypothetical protein